MRICLAQLQSIKGDVPTNLALHVKMVKQAATEGADLILFPELSLTGYEPKLANELAMAVNDTRLNELTSLAKESNMLIAVGAPVIAEKGTQIGMILLFPDLQRKVYAKQLLHDDERPYFIEGKASGIIEFKSHRLGLGICYEALQESQLEQAIANGAELYLASVAKSQKGVLRANSFFPEQAQNLQIPILMANCHGHADDFLATGQSAVWSKKGHLVMEMNSSNDGLLFYDIDKDQAFSTQQEIQRAEAAQLEALFAMYIAAKEKMESNGIYQWTDAYPTKEIIASDIQKRVLFALIANGKIVGAINISEEQEEAYQNIEWVFDTSRVLVIHRLVVHPAFQGKGYARNLMDFAEMFAVEHEYTSIQLDAYSVNKRVNAFYLNRGYEVRGEAFFPYRNEPFYCMEKAVEFGIKD